MKKPLQRKKEEERIRSDLTGAKGPCLQDGLDESQFKSRLDCGDHFFHLGHLCVCVATKPITGQTWSKDDSSRWPTVCLIYKSRTSWFFLCKILLRSFFAIVSALIDRIYKLICNVSWDKVLYACCLQQNKNCFEKFLSIYR